METWALVSAFLQNPLLYFSALFICLLKFFMQIEELRSQREWGHLAGLLGYNGDVRTHISLSYSLHPGHASEISQV